jgi:hypothetical protein
MNRLEDYQKSVKTARRNKSTEKQETVEKERSWEKARKPNSLL